MELIGRTKEQEVLRRYTQSSEAEFVAVYGRRRVGKTFLVKKFFNNSFTFFATGVANSDTKTQLAAFHEALVTYGSNSTNAPQTWLEAFARLRELIERSVGTGRKVLFLDELPWFDTHKSGFITALEYFWNSYASTNDRLLLIVCGSATSWMINKLIRNHGGLHNRVTGRILLEQFTLGECQEYFAAQGIVMSKYQIIEAYMILGGIPYYLKYFDKRFSLAQNIDALCFAKDAPLKDEYEILFASLFKNPQRYIQIIEALSSKTKGLSREELLGLIDTPDGGTLTKTLDELEQSGFIRKYLPFGATKKGALFQLVDFYSLFYLTFIKDNKNPQFWSRFQITPKHNAWSGYAFEQVCAWHIDAIKRALGIQGVLTTVSSWRSKAQANNKPGTQIDLIIDRDDGLINLCEVKYLTDDFVVDKAYEQVLRTRRSLFISETKTRKAIHLTMITTYGIKHNEYSNIIQSEITAEDLF
jgi:AAA+ ATPase superfamily predicted ATPase